MLTSYNGKDLAEIVGAVYDCVADETGWDAALEQIRVVSGGFLTMLGVIDTATNGIRFSAASGDKRALMPITGIQAANFTFLHGNSEMEIDQPYDINALYAAQGPGSREKWIRSQLYQNWVIPNNIVDCVWLPLVKSANRNGHFVLVRTKDAGAVTTDDMKMIGQIAPHLRRAVVVGDLFETKPSKGEIFRDVIDALHSPVLIVSADMQILFANSSAEKMLREDEVICSRAGKLKIKFQHAGNAIEHAVATSKKDEFILGPSGINVPLLRTQVPAVAHVMPLTRRDHPHRVSHKAVAAIFIATAGNAPVPAMDAIGALFGLTPAEKNIAAQIAAGRKPVEIAEMSGTSENTVRTHIRALFDKTGTNDQRDLSALIKELTPPVRGG